MEGGRGSRVYRHKDDYYVKSSISDSSDPCGLGLEILNEIPRNVSKAEFDEWVRKTREYHDVYGQRDFAGEVYGMDPFSCYMAWDQPENDLFIDFNWMYEIDLDNLVFHVDSQPLFRLDNMPPDSIFLKSISFDHFGHRAVHEHTPTQYRYHWRVPPPSPLPESLVAYNRHNNRSSTSSIHDLLNIPVAPSSIDRVCTAFVEVLVTRCMTELSVGRGVRILEKVSDRNQITQDMLELAMSLVHHAVGVPIPSLPCSAYKYGDSCVFAYHHPS
jgi:hypothetical protein